MQLVAAPYSSGASLLGDRDNAETVRSVIGIDLAHKLSSDVWQDREAGLWALTEAINTGKLPLPPTASRVLLKSAPPLWEVVLSIVKAALLDPASHVNVAVYDVVVAITPDVDQVRTSVTQPSTGIVPWDSLDVQIPYGSLVKTLMGRIGDPRKRVADVIRRTIVRLSQTNRQCFGVIAKALVAPLQSSVGGTPAATPSTPLTSTGSFSGAFPGGSDAGLKHFAVSVGRLRTLADVLDSPLIASGLLSLPFEAALNFVLASLKSSCSTIVQLAKHCAEQLLTCNDADSGKFNTQITAFLTGCDVGTRLYLESVMSGHDDGMDGDDLQLGIGGKPVNLNLGVAGIGIAGAPTGRSDAASSARSVDSEGDWEGLGIQITSSNNAYSPARARSPTSLHPPNSPITASHALGSPLSAVAASPLRRPVRNAGSAGPVATHGDTSVGIALTGDVGGKRAPLAGRRAASARVSRALLAWLCEYFFTTYSCCCCGLHYAGGPFPRPC